jgi:hypothetical protein
MLIHQTLSCRLIGKAAKGKRGCLIPRRNFGEQEPVVSGIDYPVKLSSTNHTFQIVTFKSTFIDVGCDTSPEFKSRLAFGARNKLRAMHQKHFVR